MRKIISVVLTAMMIFSLVAVGVFSTNVMAANEGGKVEAGYTPEGTAINTAAELAAVTAEGKYYLAADITMTSTITTEFKGTLDGNGKTVTVSSALFATLNGATVKNLTVEGTVTMTEAKNVGAVAMEATNSTFVNVVNKATVHGPENGSTESKEDESFQLITTYHRLGTGGVVGKSYGSITFEDCENFGAIDGLTPGGLVGYADQIELPEGSTETLAPTSFTFKNCYNAGEISDKNHTVLQDNGGDNKVVGAAGGLAGYISALAGTVVTFEKCTNDATVDCSETVSVRAGGLVGYVYCADISENYPTATFTDCNNNGNITGGDQVGGIAGWVRAAQTSVNCHNTGDIVSLGNYAAGVIARSGRDKYDGLKNDFWSFTDCSNTGSVGCYRQYSAGISGYCASQGQFTNCVNRGNILGPINQAEDKVMICYSGGIFGMVGDRVEVEYCENYGNIVGTGSTGGLGGKIGAKGRAGFYSFKHCLNAGNVELKTIATHSNDTSTHKYSFSNGCAGGIAGYGYGTSSHFPIVFYCGVTGNVTNQSLSAGGIWGYYNTSSASFECNYIFGTMDVLEEKAVVPSDDRHPGDEEARKSWIREYGISWNNVSESNGYWANFFLDTNLPSALCFQNGVETPLDGYQWICTAEEVANGTLCFKLNEEADDHVFWQRLTGDNKDTMPMFDPSHGYVLKDENGNFYNVDEAPTTEETTTEEVTTEETPGGEESTSAEGGEVTTEAGGEVTTEAGGETTKAPTTGGDDAQGGCKSAIGASVAAVLLLMVSAPAVLLKKKED